MGNGVVGRVLVAADAVLLQNFCPISRFSARLSCAFTPSRVAALREVTSVVIMTPHAVEGVAGAVVGVGQQVSVGVGGFRSGGVSEVAGEFQDGQAAGESGAGVGVAQRVVVRWGSPAAWTAGLRMSWL